MQITESICIHCHNVRNNTYIDRYHWYISTEPIWLEQAANLYEDLLKISNKLKKAGMQDIKELI